MESTCKAGSTTTSWPCHLAAPAIPPHCTHTFHTSSFVGFAFRWALLSVCCPSHLLFNPFTWLLCPLHWALFILQICSCSLHFWLSWVHFSATFSPVSQFLSCFFILSLLSCCVLMSLSFFKWRGGVVPHTPLYAYSVVTSPVGLVTLVLMGMVLRFPFLHMYLQSLIFEEALRITYLAYQWLLEPGFPIASWASFAIILFDTATDFSGLFLLSLWLCLVPFWGQGIYTGICSKKEQVVFPHIEPLKVQVWLRTQITCHTRSILLIYTKPSFTTHTTSVCSAGLSSCQKAQQTWSGQVWS